LAESSTTLDQLNAGAITLFGTFATSYLAGFTAADGFVYQPFLTSQIQSTFSVKPPLANVVGHTVVSTVLNTVIGSMERRAQYRRGSV
jgi:hypothetical protein